MTQSKYKYRKYLHCLLEYLNNFTACPPFLQQSLVFFDKIEFDSPLLNFSDFCPCVNYWFLCGVLTCDVVWCVYVQNQPHFVGLECLSKPTQLLSSLRVVMYFVVWCTVVCMRVLSITMSRSCLVLSNLTQLLHKLRMVI